METILMILLIAVSVLMITTILLQQSDGSLGIMGGATDSSSQKTRRGAEKTLLYITVVLAILFCGLSFTLLLI